MTNLDCQHSGICMKDEILDCIKTKSINMINQTIP